MPLGQVEIDQDRRPLVQRRDRRILRHAVAGADIGQPDHTGKRRHDDAVGKVGPRLGIAHICCFKLGFGGIETVARRMAGAGKFRNPRNVAPRLVERHPGKLHGKTLMDRIEPDENISLLDPLFRPEQDLDDLARNRRVEHGRILRRAGADGADDHAIFGQRDLFDQHPRRPAAPGRGLARALGDLCGVQPEPAAGDKTADDDCETDLERQFQ